jgi:hypothetical protein
MLKVLKPRRLLMLGGAVVFAGAGFAFMAGNTVSATTAGVGVGAISGYTVSNINYSISSQPLVPGDTFIGSFTMTLNPDNAPASNVIAWFTNGGGDGPNYYVSGYYHCTLSSTDSTADTSTYNCSAPTNPGYSTPLITWGSTYAPTELAKGLFVSAAQ